MKRKLYLSIFLSIFLILSNIVYAIDNVPEQPKLKEDDIFIHSEKEQIYIFINKNIISLKEGQPINFKIDDKEYLYPEDKNGALDKFYLEILDGQVKEVEDETIIEKGILYIETNLGDILIDNDGIFLHNKQTYKVDDDFENHLKYNEKFTKEYKKILELKETTNQINYNLINLEKKFSNLKEDFVKKYEHDIDEQSYKNTQLEQRVQSLEGKLQDSKQVGMNKESSSEIKSTTTVQENIYENKGNLQVVLEVPKSLEKINQDVFIELEKTSKSENTTLYYLSSFNNFRNTHQLEVGDYRVKSIFFLNPSLGNDYKFEHNNLVKVLENETTYFIVEALDLNESIEEDLLFENLIEETEEEDLTVDNLYVENETSSKKSKKGFAIFLGLLIAISILLVWKFDIFNKIIYKE